VRPESWRREPRARGIHVERRTRERRRVRAGPAAAPREGRGMSGFERPFADLSDSRVREGLTHSCGSPRWGAAVRASRPVVDRDALFAAADRAFALLEPADWMQAFAQHPRIGDVAGLRQKFAGTATWASEEQKGTAGASEQILRRLADGNRAYEERFGYI